MDNLLKAKHTQATQSRLMRSNKSFKFRLNAIAFAGQRKGKVWPT